MALIQNYKEDNDPRQIIDRLDDPNVSKPVQPFNAGEAEQMMNAGVPTEGMPVDNEAPPYISSNDTEEQLPPQGNEQNPLTEGAPLSVEQFTPVTADQQIFQSVSQVDQATSDEARELQNQELFMAGESLQSGMLTGTVYPSLYETDNTRQSLNELQDRTNQLVYSSTEESIANLMKNLQEPIRKRIQTPADRDNLSPSLDSSRTLRDSVMGTLSPLYNNMKLAFENADGNALSSTIEGDVFDPFGGIIGFADRFAKDPLSAIPSILNPIGGGLLGESTFGEYGKGGLGAAMYALDFISNVPIAAGTDLLNKIQGRKRPEGQQLNVLQALQGQDYSFSNIGDDKRRLSLTNKIDVYKEAETWEDLRNTNWLNRISPDLMLGQAVDNLLTGSDEISDMPSKVVDTVVERSLGIEDVGTKLMPRLLQARDFTLGLGLDALTGSAVDTLVKAGKKGIGKVIGKRVAKEAEEKVVTSLSNNALEAAQESPTLALPPARDAADDISNAFNNPDANLGEIEEFISQNLKDTNLRSTLGGEAVTSEVVDDLVQSPKQLAPSYNKISPEALNPPNIGFPSKALIEEGTKRKTSVVLDIAEDFGTDTSDFKFFEPLDVNTVRRTNSELTNLAISRGDIPARSVPLSDTRLTMLNEAHEGMYSRYGRSLDDIQMKLPEGVTDDVIDVVATEVLDDSIEDIRKAFKAADTFVDDVVNPPKSTASIMEYQRLNLPENLTARTEEAINLTRNMLRTEQIYSDLANEATELKLKYSQETSALMDMMDVLEEVPDIGRRNLFENPKMPVEYIPNSEPPLRIVPQSSNREVLTELINEVEFYHGTKDPNLNLRIIDPVQGGSRSEAGIGIHLTPDATLGIEYASATPGKNVPPVATRKIEARGAVNQVKVNVTNPLETHLPLTEEATEVLLQTLDTMPTSELSSVAKKALKGKIKQGDATYVDVLAKLEEVAERYYVADGMDFPEETVLNLQRMFTQNLRHELGVDAFWYEAPNGVPQLTLLGKQGDNGIVDIFTAPVSSKTDAITQATSRANVDGMASAMFPKSTYAKVNKMESQVGMVTQMTQRTADQVDKVDRQLSSLAENLAQQESTIRKQARAEKVQRLARKEQTWKKQNETQIQHWNKPEEGIC